MPATNDALASIFSEMAAILELTGANRFRVNAHSRVAEALREMTDDVAELAADQSRLAAVDGIGAKSVKKIVEFVETGAVAEHEALKAEIPAGLLDLLKISGLGPKTVHMLWTEGGVTDLPSLEAAIESGVLVGLPRMGEKTVQNIRESIAFMKRAGQRTRIGTALPIAESIAQMLRGIPGAERVEYTGSLRRGRETIGDIDILAAGTDAAAIADAFCTMDGVEKVLVAGQRKCSVRLAKGLQIDLRVVEPVAYGAALMYFTGSKAHNVTLRERAIKAGLRLNEYGLFPGADEEDTPPQDRGVEPVAAATEEDIYAALDLPWFPPTVREDRGEFRDTVPPLITIDDVRAELHAHTTASDGRMSIKTLIDEAKSRGYETIAVTDHSRSSVQAGGLTVERLRQHITDVRAAADEVDGITVLVGSEVDILVDGTLDYDDEVLAELDIVVASPHAALGQDPAVATARLLKAIEHPLVHIIGHPTGRVIGQRAGLQPDMSTLIAAAAEHGTALEINANPSRLDLRDTHVRAAVDAGVLIAIDTDTHRARDFDHLRFGVLTGQRGWLTANQCVNTWTVERLRRWLERKHAMI